MDNDDLRAKVIEAVRVAERNIAVIVGIDLEDEGLREKVVEAVKAAEKGLNVIVGIDPDDDGLKEKVKAAAAAAGAGARIKVPIDPDAKGLGAKVKAAAQDAKPTPIDVPVKVDGKTFEAEFRAAMDQADKVSLSASSSMKSSFSSLESSQRTLKQATEETGNSAQKAGAAVETAGKKADGAGSGAGNASSGFGFLHSRMVLLGAGALALAPALAAVPTAMAGAALGAGLMAAAFGGVIGALKDYAAQSGASAASGSSSAATAFGNAMAIRNAEQAIFDAKKQAAQAAVQSAEQVASAEQRLTQSQQSLVLAQDALTAAQRDGVNVLKDLNLANEDAANSVVDAQDAVIDAQAAYDKAKNNSLLTDQQKKEALHALIDAQQRLKDAQQRAVETQQAADDANKKGVDGSTAVVSAQRNVDSAARAAADSQHALANAQRAAAQQQKDSAEQVAKAVQSLADTQKMQALQAQAAGGATNKFAQDMAKLTQPGRDFVNQVLSMKDGLHGLSVTAQNATLPGVTQMLKDSAGLFPTVNGAIDQMGKAVGGTAIQFGNLMKSPAFQGNLKDVLQQAAGLATQLGTGMVGMVSGITQAAAHAGPVVDGLGSGLQTIMTSGIPAFFDGLMKNAGGIGQLFSGLGGLVSNLMGPLGTVAGAVATALAPAVAVLASPAVAQSLRDIGGALASMFISLSPVVTMFAQGLAGALKIAVPLLQATAKFLQDNHRWVVPLVTVLGGMALAWWAVNAAMSANPLVIVAGLVAALVVGVIYCWEHFKGFRDFVKLMWKDLQAYFLIGWHFIQDIWDKIVAGTKLGWQLVRSYILDPIKHAYDDVVTWVGNIIDFVKGMPGKLAAIGVHMWDWISRGISNVTGSVSSGFHTLINNLIDGINWALGYVNGATKSISEAWTWIPGASGSAIPPIKPIPPWLATGGVAGGLIGMNEAGIEMVRLPNGSVVMPHANTASALQSGGTGGTQTLQVMWIGDQGGDELLTWIRKNIRIIAGGGPNSVQRALGQSF